LKRLSPVASVSKPTASNDQNSIRHHETPIPYGVPKERGCSYRLKRNRTAYGIEFRWTGKPQQQHENTPTME
jgi:hypothetical protein